MFSLRTDLAVEAREICEEEGIKVSGIEVNEFKNGEINITDVKVINKEGEKKIGKPIGSYVTIDMPEFTHYDSDIMDELSRVVAAELSKKLNLEESMTALVVGLGNWNITPDALGPKVISRLMITRHLKQLVPDSIDEGIRPVCAIAPGVLGLTGIETGEIVKGVVNRIKPDVIICIDSLASRNLKRVNSTIQICDTGISPGSGVGNKRKEISEKNLGKPVIAIGVPTVVDAATIANDTIDLVLDEMIKQSKNGGEFYNMLKSIDKEEKQVMISEILNPYGGNLMVTPKEVDMVVESISKIIANGINISLQPALDLEDINRYIN